MLLIISKVILILYRTHVILDTLFESLCQAKEVAIMTNKENELKKKTYEQEYFT